MLASIRLPHDSIQFFFICFFLAFLLYLLAWLWSEKSSAPQRHLWILILGGGLLFRFTLFPITPYLSDDIYRYAWEGIIQSHGVNPYEFAPADPSLAQLQEKYQDIYSQLNHHHVSAAYPPGVQILHAAAAQISSSIYAQKALALIFDLLILALLSYWLFLRQAPLARVILYAWNPLIIMEFAGSGHNDSIAIFFFLLSIFYLASGREVLSVFSLALSVLSKFWALGFLPFLLRAKPKSKLLSIFCLVMLLGYLPYLDAGWNLFAGISIYAQHWQHNSLSYSLLNFLSFGLDKFYVRLMLVTLLLLSILWIYHKNYPWMKSAFLLIALFLLFNPTVHPWYVTWIVPFFCFYLTKPWLYFSGAVVLAYHVLPAWFTAQDWMESPAFLCVEYLPFLALLLFSNLPGNSKAAMWRN